MPATFEDLNRLFLFTHLTPTYRERSWVLVDGDEAGEQAISKLKERFPSDLHRHFYLLSRPAFENYYPKELAEKVSEALAVVQPDARREAKRKLLSAVMVWLDEDVERGRAALQESAAEVIALLRKFEASILQKKG